MSEPEQMTVPQIFTKLKRDLGLPLLKFILGNDVSRWRLEKEIPNSIQKRTIYSLYNIIDLLKSHLTTNEAMEWLIYHSEYLYGIPAVEIKSRPDDVYLAALNRVTRGEFYDLQREAMSGQQQDHHKTDEEGISDT